jgi:hypothetical protein
MSATTNYNDWVQKKTEAQNNGTTFDAQAPLAGLNQNGYQYANFIYPMDLGVPGSGKDHYMIFHINESTMTQFQTTSGTVIGNTQSTLQQNQVADQTAGLGSGTSKPVTNADGTSVVGASGTSQNPTMDAVKQNTTRVATTIVLYMPPDIQAHYTTEWNAKELGEAAEFTKSLTGAGSLRDLLTSSAASFTKEAGEKLNQFTNLSLADALSRQTRLMINPHLEVIFEGIGFRQFQFSFRFTPESESEAENVDNIIRAFKFYSAPEILKGTAGRFWIYPAEFDIQYYSNGVENEFLNKISTCALVDMNVNYTASGQWSAFRPHATIPGSPSVCTDITLTFKELELMTKSRILENYVFIPLWFIPIIIYPIISVLHKIFFFISNFIYSKPMPVYIETWCIIATLLLMWLMAKRMLALLPTLINDGENINEMPITEKVMRSMKQFANTALKTLHLK